MDPNENEFEDMIELYNDVKEKKINESIEILSNYRSHHCRYEKFQGDHIINKNDLKEKLKEFYKKITDKELEDTKDLCDCLNELLNEDLIHKLDQNELRDIISKHSHILYYIKNNEDLTDEIRNRLINRIIIEENFSNYIIKRLKFKLSNLNEEDYRFSLSSTTICSYAIAKYMDLWNENHKDYNELGDLESYYIYIIDSLGTFLEPKRIDSEDKLDSLQAIDEFSLLNIIGKLKNISEKITRMFNWEEIPGKDEDVLKEYLIKNYDDLKWIDSAKFTRYDDNKIIDIMNENEKASIELYGESKAILKYNGIEIGIFLTKIENNCLKIYNTWNYREKTILELIYRICVQYNENKLMFQDNTHPFIYYRFLQMLFNWREKILNHEKYDFEDRQYYQRWTNQNYFNNILDEIYLMGKYEMYRQISLYKSNDKSLFDAKRLIYSLLIVSKNDRYSNKKVRDEALKIIFDELLETGLWPIGNDVNTDFVLDQGVIKSKTSRIISSSPTLSSIECLNDLLEENVLVKEIEGNSDYQLKLKKTYEWVKTRLRYDSKSLSLTKEDIISSEGLIQEIINLKNSKSVYPEIKSGISNDLRPLLDVIEILYSDKDPILIEDTTSAKDGLSRLINVLKDIKSRIFSSNLSSELFSLKMQILLDKIDDSIKGPDDLINKINSDKSDNSLDQSLLLYIFSKKKDDYLLLYIDIYELLKTDLISIIIRDLNKKLNEIRLSPKLKKEFSEIFGRVLTIRTNQSNIPIGWYPEYEGTHTSKSWMVGHTLIFLKNYCELLSRLIRKNAADYLHAKSYKEIGIEWKELRDSYEIKNLLNGMLVGKYNSAFVFGPPGTGKSTIAKAMAKELKYDYVEITPGQFLAEGEQKIITKANFLFKRIKRMKKSVIFFDEVDQFVELREQHSESTSKWIVTSLLPEFQELHNIKEIKFILATNNIGPVDPAMKRSGRIDFVLPMGPISWKDRLRELVSSIRKNLSGNSKQIGDDLLKELELDNLVFDCLELKQIYEKNVDFIKDYLTISDYMLYAELSEKLDNYMMDLKNNRQLSIEDFLKTYRFFEEEDIERYINPQFCEFHNISLILKEKKFVRFPISMQQKLREKYGTDIIIEIIAHNNFNSLLVVKDIINYPENIYNELEKLNNNSITMKIDLTDLKNYYEDGQKHDPDEQKIKLARFLNNLILTSESFYQMVFKDKGEHEIAKKIIKQNPELEQQDDESVDKNIYKIIMNRLALEKLCNKLIKERNSSDIEIKYKVR